MSDKTLNKVCTPCGNIGMGMSPYYAEFIKSKEDGKGRHEQKYICHSCKADLTKRCMRAILEIMPRALRENMIHKLKETYSGVR